MDRASVFVWQFQEALSTRQHISLKISTKIIFDLSQRQQNHNTTTDKKTLPFLLSSWQCFAGILPLSQWLCRKSTTWFMSLRMRRQFSPLKCCSICCARARAELRYESFYRIYFNSWLGFGCRTFSMRKSPRKKLPDRWFWKGEKCIAKLEINVLSFSVLTRDQASHL